MKAFVRWLDEIGDDELPQVGGKALNLARLLRAGFDVPRGFVLSGDFPAEHPPGDGRPTGLPGDLREEVIRCYARLGRPAVAVRSSAVGEDSLTASFAGQGRTILNVSTEQDLLAAVATVLHSMEASSARDYAERMAASGGLTVHVLVQEMVAAEMAGVLFTANPLSGQDDQIVINATWGQGEPLVSGRVAPDEVVVDKAAGRPIRSSIGSKEWTLTPAGLHPTPAEKAASPCLRDEHIRQLAQAAHRVEAVFGGPQDIEWAWDNRLRLLQTRPLTTRPPAASQSPPAGPCEAAEKLWRQEIVRLQSQPAGRSSVYVASGMAELLPCPTPLSFEVAARLMSGREGYGLAQRRLGFDPAAETILERVAGHVYVDLGREARLFFRHAPLGPVPAEIRENPLRAYLPRMTFRWRLARPAILFRWPMLLYQVARSVVRQRRVGREFPDFFERDWLPAFRGYVDEQRHKDLSRLDAAGLLAEFHRRLDHFLSHSAPVALTGSILAAMRYRELEDLLISHMGQAGIELAHRLMSGLRPNPMLEMHEAMDRLARREMSEAQFLQRFGHRCGSEEFELAVPRWREEPAALRVQVEHIRQAGHGDGKPADEGRIACQQAQAQLDDRTRAWGRVARQMVWGRLDSARRLFPLREQSKDCLLMEFETLRQPLVMLDRTLDLSGGISHLCLAEMGDAVRQPGHARRLIAERRQQHELHRQLNPPHVLVGPRHDGREAATRQASDGELTGMGVSPGIADGLVRVVESAEDLAAVQRGEILVVRFLEPTWASVFVRAAGFVAERGATLSHGAIVAREFGLPAVVNVPDARTRLRTGQRVRVDGLTGRIQKR